MHQYEGGYAAYVLARAERERQASAREDRRQQLLRKELAWLRRGPPARTSKPKFRIEAANAMIADEPEARDRVELLKFASSRLGGKVIEAEGVGLAFGSKVLLKGMDWHIGPGDRIGLVGVNGSGKSSLTRVLAKELEPDAGTVEHGQTVRLAHLSQDTAEIPGGLRVLQAVEEVRGYARLGDGSELTAGSLVERFGFKGEKQRTLVKDLSGGERRRLQLMRLLMSEPNVLLLDEPTNDLDIDTLTALEDLLDGWPGTLIVVSHDRYFVERVCDNVYALLGEGSVTHLPGGIDQYLTLREPESAPAASRENRSTPNQSVVRAARKEAARLERALEKAGEREEELHTAMAAAATDYGSAARAPGRSRRAGRRARDARGRVAGGGRAHRVTPAHARVHALEPHPRHEEAGTGRPEREQRLLERHPADVREHGHQPFPAERSACSRLAASFASSCPSHGSTSAS